MIRVRYRRADDSHNLVMEGHADYARHGEDIVCAGASAIVFALLGWLENYSEDLSCIDTEVSSGDVTIACIGGERTAAAFEMTAIGLMQLADSYPAHVEVDIVGIAD